MTQRFNYPFTAVVSTAPSFQISGTLISTAQALESTAVNRVWSGPGSRSVRFVESSGIDYYIKFGSSTVVAASSDSMEILGGTETALTPPPDATYVAIRSISTSSAAVVNVTIGYGR